jgi:hypothetical protein
LRCDSSWMALREVGLESILWNRFGPKLRI